MKSSCNRNRPERVKNHGEQDEFAQQRHHQTGRRDNLGQQQEEHSQRQQNWNGQTHLQIQTIARHVLHSTIKEAIGEAVDTFSPESEGK